jgi:D-inositol-3-phosphate glycosyltransferase
MSRMNKMAPTIMLPYAGTAVGGSYVSSALVAGYLHRHGAYCCRPLLPGTGPVDTLFHEAGLLPVYYDLAQTQIKRMRMTRGLVAKIRGLPAHLGMVKTAVVQLRHHQPHLVHINDDRTFLAWALAARWLRIPVIWHVRNAEGNSYLDPLRLRLSSYLIFAADAVRHRFSGAVSLPPNTTIYNAVDFNRFGPVTSAERTRLRAQAGMTTNSLLIGLVANLEVRKRPDWAIRTVIDLRRAGHDVAFVWCGSDPSQGDYERRLRQMVTQAGMDEHFHFLGYCAEAEKVMQSLDILLLTSTVIGEAFPRVVIEAMACSTAVLSTRCGGVAEAIENGRNGILVEADDYPALLSAAEQLVIEPDYRRQLAETAVTTVRARFSLSQISQQVAQVYEYLLRH